MHLVGLFLFKYTISIIWQTEQQAVHFGNICLPSSGRSETLHGHLSPNCRNRPLIRKGAVPVRNLLTRWAVRWGTVDNSWIMRQRRSVSIKHCPKSDQFVRIVFPITLSNEILFKDTKAGLQTS